MRTIYKEVVMSELRGDLVPAERLYGDERVVVTNVYGDMVILNSYDDMLEYAIEQFAMEEFSNEYMKVILEGPRDDIEAICEMLNEVTCLSYVLDEINELVNKTFKPRVATVRGY